MACHSIEAIKFDICCAARALYRAGLSAGVAGHLSVAIGENKMLMNRFGPSFGTLRPADICTFDFDGKVLEHDPSVDPYVNDTIALHAVIHRLNPQIVALAHTHPPATVSWGTFRRIPEIYDQESCILAGDVGIVEEDYTGTAASEDRVRPFADAVAKYRGRDPAQPWRAYLRAEHPGGADAHDAAGRNVCAQYLRGDGGAGHRLKPIPIKMEHALTAKSEIAAMPAIPAVWKDTLERLQKTDPELFEYRPKSAVA